MRQIFVNIYLVLLATLVVSLSIGVSISKMQCSKDGKIFIGAEIPNCMEKQAIACDIVLNEISCCQKEEAQESCCPQTNDNSCAGETANIQFDFEIDMIIIMNQNKTKHMIFNSNYNKKRDGDTYKNTGIEVKPKKCKTRKINFM